jgi:hypothetical protein
MLYIYTIKLKQIEIMKEKIIDYNRMIAIFMGAKEGKTFWNENALIIECDLWYRSLWSNQIQDEFETYAYKVDELPYHLNWDWLMSVVEKIESIGFHTTISKIDSLVFHNCFIKHNVGEKYEYDYADAKRQERILSRSKIEATYKAIVEFIVWYNENK